MEHAEDLTNKKKTERLIIINGLFLMECFGTTDFDNNSRLKTLSAIIISGRHSLYIYTHTRIRQIYCKIQGKGYFQTEHPKNKGKISASNCAKSVTPLVESDMDVYRSKDGQRLAQPLTATHTAVTNMTRRGEGADKDLFPPVRPDLPQQLRLFIFL